MYRINKFFPKFGLDYYYFKEDNSPLCLPGESPTIVTASKFLDLPQNNETKLELESRVKNK